MAKIRRKGTKLHVNWEKASFWQTSSSKSPIKTYESIKSENYLRPPLIRNESKHIVEQIIAMLMLSVWNRRKKNELNNKIDRRYYYFFIRSFVSILFLIQFRYFVEQNQLIACPGADADADAGVFASFSLDIFYGSEEKTFFFLTLNRIKFANGTAFGREFSFKWMNLDEACVRVCGRANIHGQMNEIANAWHAMHKFAYFE